MTLKALATPFKSSTKLNYYTVAIILKSFKKAKCRLCKKPFLMLQSHAIERLKDAVGRRPPLVGT
jgi:hypothetical protein